MSAVEGSAVCVVWAIGCLRDFSAGLLWSCFPSLPVPSYIGPYQELNLTQCCCGKCNITKLLSGWPLKLRISCSCVVLKYDLDFV